MLAVVPLVSLTDRQDARRIYLASSALSALSCFGMAFCDSLLPALGFRAVAGIAYEFGGIVEDAVNHCDTSACLRYRGGAGGRECAL